MQLHPLCELFPRISGDEFEKLKSDIQDNGLVSPIVLLDGMILDGANRYRACMAVGVAPKFTTFDGKDPIAFALSVNLHRRHLTSAQRAVIASDLAKLEIGANQHQKEGGGIQPPSQSDAAKMMDVSRDSVKKARKVSKAVPDSVIEAVRSGDVSLTSAEKVIDFTEEEKQELSELPAEKIGEAIKKVSAKKTEKKEDPVIDQVPQESEIDQLRSFVAEQGMMLEQVLAENELIHQDDPMKAVMDENRKLREQVRVLTERIHSLTNEKAAAITQAKKYKSALERLERNIKRAA